ALARKKGVDALVDATIRSAQERGLIPARARAAVDATGLETRHISRYFVWRQGQRHQRYSWPKLTAVVEIHSHLYLSAHVSKRPSHHSPHFRPPVPPPPPP